MMASDPNRKETAKVRSAIAVFTQKIFEPGGSINHPELRMYTTIVSAVSLDKIVLVRMRLQSERSKVVRADVEFPPICGFAAAHPVLLDPPTTSCIYCLLGWPAVRYQQKQFEPTLG
jgi:hypothetical protein